MNREMLFESMRGIDGAILERSETNTAARRRVWKTLIGAAACFCAVLAAATILPGLFSGKSPAPPVADVTPPSSTPSDPIGSAAPEEPLRTWTASYNDATTMADIAFIVIPGYFTEELNEFEIAAVTPDRRMGWMEYSGNAGFDGDGNLVQVSLTVATMLPDTNIDINISEAQQAHGCFLLDDPIISQCGDVEYTIYQCNIDADHITLDAYATINGRYFSFQMTTASSDLGQAKETFQQVLECFTYYPEDSPDLSAVTAESIPEWFDRKLTQAEALDDPAFGAYMLKNVPTGFAAESIRRYKDQNSDYLSGLWTKGTGSLSWNVSYFSDDDAARLAGVADPEKYDLSLYPIPRADSVPIELREIVDDPIFDADELILEAVYARAYKVSDAGDTDGWRMNFSVKYGNILVEISSKGVAPEWVYEQLICLR